MKPNGLVAAASIADQMSTPRSFANIASSLTSAMFTWRNVFSRSFTSSASPVDATGTTLSTSDAVERFDCGERRGVDARYDLRRVHERPRGVAGIDALGRVAEEEVGARREAGRLEDRAQELLGRPGIRGRLQHDERSRFEALRQVATGRLDEREVGSAVAERRRHGDHGDLERTEVERIARGVVAAVERQLELLVGDVLDVRPSAPQRLDPCRRRRSPRPGSPFRRHAHRDRKAHVSLADERDLRSAVFDPLEKPRKVVFGRLPRSESPSPSVIMHYPAANITIRDRVAETRGLSPALLSGGCGGRATPRHRSGGARS